MGVVVVWREGGAARPGAGRAGRAPLGPAGRRPGATSGWRALPAQQPVPEGVLRAYVFAMLFLEVEAGLRPRRQLIPLMTPGAFAQLQTVWVRGAPARRLLQVAACAADPVTVDAVALAAPPRGRTAAIALTLRRTPRRWLVAAAWRPEDGPPACLDDDADDWPIP